MSLLQTYFRGTLLTTADMKWYRQGSMQKYKAWVGNILISGAVSGTKLYKATSKLFHDLLLKK